MTSQGRHRINWIQLRAEYVSGDESFALLALRHGTTTKRIEQHALDRRQNAGNTWGELRKSYRAETAKQLLRDAGKIASENAQLRLLATNEAMKKILVRIQRNELNTSDLIQAAKLGIDARLEITGAGGGPVDHAIDLSEIDDDTRKAVGSAVAALLRGAAKSRATSPPNGAQSRW